MGIISFERCLKIVFEREYSYKFYISILFSFFVVSVINAIITPLNNGFFILPNAIYCLFDPSKTGGLIGSIITGLSCGTAYSMIIICYLTICVHRRSESQKAQLELGLDPAKVKQAVNTTIIKSLSIMVASLSTSGVYVSIMVISWFHPAIFTNLTDMIQVFFIEPQMIINVIILLNLKPELWKGLKKLFGFCSE
ncbi:hypothetical protein CONCODRAFT_11728 [Conidiobolus coronatus NRRL 28638]|uniref:G-protein coupled receptors family 1 profile domain-containing protein n=1 Tax=Conidiobolus coronatus (strain ATCC 28846 / CBS 209.66 / NRRL 28638) TaxID=796925 RepID=A0A137NUL7_CONC2|nr:hypothetical protein CONCODRAFT_11728 [Conidiobolus coronatus NRRL 28638]|eukprot:KXN66437.1 hypothetical protein CONCODRAFT_11728 [Conidiobolus coronatus NRRL 28638]